ncbi:hypothetical protein AAC387_Pa01g4016 [Persea americana]
MGTEPVIFEISSDEDEDWLSDLLDRVNEESDSFDDVVVVDEKVACAPAIQKHKFLPSNGMKGSGSDSDDDCLILDGDPEKPITAVDDTGNGTDDLLIVGEKGQLSLRDYPHPRHLCAKFPFTTTPHDKHCDLCHCYVCDLRAPCIHWGTGVINTDHCHSTDKEEKWREQRKRLKQGNMAVPRSQEVPDTALSITLPHTTSVPALPLPGSLSMMGLSHPVQSLVSNSNQLPAFSTAFDTPNIISQRHNKCSRPSPVRNRSPPYINGVSQLIYGRQVINRERGGGSTVGLQHVASQPKFKRIGSPGISLSPVTQSEYNSSNSPQTPVPTQPRFQNQLVMQSEDFESWQDLLAVAIDSSEPGPFHDYSLTYDNSSSTNTQVHARLQVHDQSLHPLDANQSTSQSVNPTAGATNSDLLENNFNWFNATSDSIGQHVSASDSVLLPSVQPSEPSAISQHHTAPPESWMYSVDHQPVPEILTEPALSELGFDLPEPTIDPAMILFELGLAANGV